jgi:predicted HTH domain antitoxin
MGVLIPDEVLEAAHMSEEEFRQEVAVMLFERRNLTLEQASRATGVAQQQLQHLLASRQISVQPRQQDADQGTMAHSTRRDPARVAHVKSVRGIFAHTRGDLASDELHRERQADKGKDDHS